MNKNERIYVAGNGLVGTALVRKLVEQGYKNIVVRPKDTLDLRDQSSVNYFFRTYRPDYVILAAAKVGGINYNANYPADFIYDNLMIQSNVIDAAYWNGVKKLLFLGSACIYPKVTPQPIKEEYLLTSKLEPTNDAYALAKIAGLTMAKYYTQQHGLNTISLMPANLYGPNDNFFPDKCHVIPGLINKFYNAKLEGKDVVEAWGDGTPTREFLYVDDMAAACEHIMNLDKTIFNKSINPMGSHVNIGYGDDVSITELAKIICEIIGFKGEDRKSTRLNSSHT